jgi:hypothetical protein
VPSSAISILILANCSLGISDADELFSAERFFYNNFARTTQKTQPLYCWEGVYTAPLYSNGSYSNVGCVYAAGIGLPSRCVAMSDYSDFTIPAFGSHVTLHYLCALVSSIVMCSPLLEMFLSELFKIARERNSSRMRTNGGLLRTFSFHKRCISPD